MLVFFQTADIIATYKIFSLKKRLIRMLELFIVAGASPDNRPYTTERAATPHLFKLRPK